MKSLEEKIEALQARLTSDGTFGAVLVVYPPEEMLSFQVRYDELLYRLQELARRQKGRQVCLIDLRTFVFDMLEERKLVEKALRLDATGSTEIHRTLAGLLQRGLEGRVLREAESFPESILWCKNIQALYPWVSYSSLLESVEGRFRNHLVIPFPGTENGPALHFMGMKDGYNYRAARI